MAYPVPTTEHNEELFRKLLIPKIFSEILRHLKAKDRLNMRLCCHATEEAVAQSDMHIEGTPNVISLVEDTSVLTLTLGLKKDRSSLKLGKYVGGRGLKEIARMRERLFAKVFTKFVDVNVKFAPFPLIARILEGFVFEELDLIIYNSEHLADVFNYLDSLDSKTCEGIRFSLPDAFAYEECLLTLKPMQVLEIRNRATYITDEVLIAMVHQKHAHMSIRTLIAFAETIEAIKKAKNANPQMVKIEVWNDALERFMLSNGQRMIKDTTGKRFTHIFKIRHKCDPEADKKEVALTMRNGSDDKWNGDFDLDLGRVHIRARADHNAFTYTLQMSNYYRSKENGEESSDDERTAYF